MNVPYEVAIRGNAEAYGNLYKQRKETGQRKVDLSGEFRETLKSLADLTYVNSIIVFGPESWTRSLAILGLSKRLTEIAGQMIDADSETDRLKAEMEALGK